MKLLFDANLSRRLVPLSKELFPESAHVGQVGLAGETPDSSIWEFAKDNGFVIVAADTDFFRLAILHGAPPKLIKLDQRVFSSKLAAELLRRYSIEITEFGQSARPVLILLGT